MSLELLVVRFSSSSSSTLGIVSEISPGKRFLGYTLEDPYREEKVPGITRIPEGRYRLAMKHSGRFFAIYSERWEWHRGVVELLEVPDFSAVLIHAGNTAEDTRGCLLVGAGQNAKPDGGGSLVSSRVGYERFYRAIAEAVERGDAFARFVDLDRVKA